MNKAIFSFLILLLFSIHVFGQNDSILQKNRWTLTFGSKYEFATSETIHESYTSSNLSYDLNYSLYNSFSPEINISFCLDRTPKYLFPVAGISLEDNITHFYNEGNMINSNTLEIFASSNYFHQISASPFIGIEGKFPVHKKIILDFSLTSVHKIGYYYFLKNIDYTNDSKKTNTHDWYGEYNVNFIFSFGAIFDFGHKIKPGFIIYKPLLNEGGLFGNDFRLKNYYEAIGFGLLLNF